METDCYRGTGADDGACEAVGIRRLLLPLPKEASDLAMLLHELYKRCGLLVALAKKASCQANKVCATTPTQRNYAIIQNPEPGKSQ